MLRKIMVQIRREESVIGGREEFGYTEVTTIVSRLTMFCMHSRDWTTVIGLVEPPVAWCRSKVRPFP
jgi:hypothetical protein